MNNATCNNVMAFPFVLEGTRIHSRGVEAGGFAVWELSRR